MLLVDIQGCGTPTDSKTHVHIPFRVEKPSDVLHVRFSYSPKTLEDRNKAMALLDESFGLYLLPEQRKQASARAERYLPLKNLITLSIDDERGYRGACHRHDSEQRLMLSEREASPGLMKGKIGTGNWSVTLSMHCIVTERCDYRLRIWTAEE